MKDSDRIWADTWMGIICGQLFGLMDWWVAAWIVWGVTVVAAIGGLSAAIRYKGWRAADDDG